MRYGYGYGAGFRARGGASAPPYVAPTEDPVDPPAGEPDPPTDTPTDPDTGTPEPGFDPNYVEPTRIEITDSKQTVVRTSADPGTWANAYIAAALSGAQYWEIAIANSTPRNATLAVGVSTLAMPLNGIPGALAGTIAYWSDGSVKQNGATIATLAPYGRGDRIGVLYGTDGSVRFYKNCSPLNGGASVGQILAAPRYPFAGLYSADTRVAFKFSLSHFACSVPTGGSTIGSVRTFDQTSTTFDSTSVTFDQGA